MSGLTLGGWTYHIQDVGTDTISSGFLADKIASAQEAARLNANFPGSIDAIQSNILNAALALQQANPNINPLDPKIFYQLVGNAVYDYSQAAGISGDWPTYFYNFFVNRPPLLPPH